MRHLFILNPAAGRRDQTQAVAQDIARVFSGRGIPFTTAVTRQPGHGTLLVRQAAQESAEPLRVYACGGDGTLNEAVNGAAGFDHVAVTNFPGGSGNDFIRLFDRPDAFRSLENFLDCEESRFDLIACGDRYSLNVCSIGIDARIGTSIGRYKRLPLLSGSGAYILSTAVNLIKGVHRHYQIQLGDQCFDGEKTMICVANGQYYGGGFHPVPEADPSDGLLDVLLVNAVSRLQVAAIIGKYKNGQYAQYPDLISHFRCPQVTVHCDTPSEINLDGELLWGRDVTFRACRQALRFFYPRGLSYQGTKSPAAQPLLSGTSF